MLDRDRHSRHRRFPAIGDEGQSKLERARVVVIGCGALGSHSADLLARAGVGRSGGFLRLIDRDYVETTNLQRQALYDEDDAARSRPKALALAQHIAKIDSATKCEPLVRDFNSANALEFLSGADLVIDGTDNFRTRFLINDAAIAAEIPWIYGAAVSSRGAVAMFVPGSTPCLRCLLEFLPPFGSAESCDTAGIITPLPAFVAALQVATALRWIVERRFEAGIATFDLWQGGTVRRSLQSAARNPGCPSCGTRELPALRSDAEQLVTLCGRNSVQLYATIAVDLDGAAQKFASIGGVRRSPQSVTAEIDEGLLTVFDDGRVIVEGTTDPLEAKSIIARYLGG